MELVESVIGEDWDSGEGVVNGDLMRPPEALKWLIDYVVEGARIAFGIDGEPIMKLVQAANLAKAPDVEGALVAQGWRP